MSLHEKRSERIPLPINQPCTCRPGEACPGYGSRSTCPPLIVLAATALNLMANAGVAL